MILAEKITALRKKNGWSQEELAMQLNVPDSLFPNGKVLLPFPIWTVFCS